MNGSSFGRTGKAVRRYPGGTECSRIFASVLRSIPKRRPAALLLIPSPWHARRTRLYKSTEYISPPSAHRLQVSGFRLRNFTPRRSDHQTVSVVILSPGFTTSRRAEEASDVVGIRRKPMQAAA